MSDAADTDEQYVRALEGDRRSPHESRRRGLPQSGRRTHYQADVNAFKSWCDKTYPLEEPVLRYFPTYTKIYPYIRDMIKEGNENSRSVPLTALKALKSNLLRYALERKNILSNVSSESDYIPRLPSFDVDSKAKTALSALFNNIQSGRKIEYRYSNQVDETSIYKDEELYVLTQNVMEKTHFNDGLLVFAAISLLCYGTGFESKEVRQMTFKDIVHRHMVPTRRDEDSIDILQAHYRKSHPQKHSIVLRRPDVRQCPIAFLGLYLMERYINHRDTPLSIESIKQGVNIRLFRDSSTHVASSSDAPMKSMSHNHSFSRLKKDSGLIFDQEEFKKRLEHVEKFQANIAKEAEKREQECDSDSELDYTHELEPEKEFEEDPYIVNMRGKFPVPDSLVHALFPFMREIYDARYSYCLIYSANKWDEATIKRMEGVCKDMSRSELLDFTSFIARIADAFIHISTCLIQDWKFLEEAYPQAMSRREFKFPFFDTVEYKEFRVAQDKFFIEYEAKKKAPKGIN
ncbi:hypothetical protein CANCADRAFT_44859 [Tortispora caseinolytica NRRL Y-17796]|uniref:Ndc10 domain-containing protein n=1 Tax=Tortispora caseinolytica NRRL Y-17796 TaxID=767744 RepID=A0A1E4THN3_9ASCO|nr:hypothetical protein CANCADRAFT_44859 [Tortispora caseinolytica NRRL Y-17796]